jgi:hypothetical protein
MNSKHTITDETILAPYLDKKQPDGFARTLAAFIRHQCATWPELKTARDHLQQSLTKKFFLTDLEICLQHNPHRIKSSSTRVDREFIEKRPCFLCPDRLYENQKALVYQKEWLILNNPYPIFPDHLVIAHNGHLPQDINACLRSMTGFVRALDFSYTAFYNGPACGASAPDHLHFQACPEGGIPITRQLAGLPGKMNGSGQLSIIKQHNDCTCYIAELDCRALFLCMTPHLDFLHEQMTAVLKFLKEETRNAEEPMINVMISGGNGVFTGIIFPRKAHRPACYFKKDRDMMLVSPGAVDVGGLMILPRHEDYERMNRELLLGIFSEVCYGKEIFKNLVI